MGVELFALAVLGLATVGLVMVALWSLRGLGALARLLARPFRRRQPAGLGSDYERLVRRRD